MPIGNPIEGELWESRDPLSGRTMRGVVAEATPTLVTLVSITGNRLRNAPSRMVQNWTFASNPPRTPFICSRRGCASQAAFWYRRGTSPDYVCARHAPVGVRLDFVDDQPGTVPDRVPGHFQDVTPCWNCGNLDPVEAPDNTRPHGTSTWSCLACNNYWVAISNTGVPLSEQNLGHWWLDVLQLCISSLPNMRSPTRIQCHPTVVNVLREVLANSPSVGGSRPLGAGLEMVSVSTVPVVPELAMTPWTATIQTTTLHQVANTPDIAMRNILRQHDVAASLISVGSRWAHPSGQVFDVIAVKDGAVSFRKDAQSFTMLQDDFLQIHKPFVVDTGEAPAPPIAVELHPGEEWESEEGTVQITTIDSKRELVYVQWLNGAKGTTRPFNLRSFATSKWRKIERRTAYQRIMDDED